MTDPAAIAASTIPPRPRGGERMRLWYRTLRAPSLLTSVVPAAAGGLTAIGARHADWWLLAVALLALLCLHAGTNISNDVEDAARGVDPPDKVLRNSQVFNTGRLTIAEGRRLYGSCFGVGLLLGIVIAAVQGPAILVIGIIGLLGGLLYTAGPRPYKYLGLGEGAIVLLMGPLMTQGAATAVSGDAFSAQAFWTGIGPGLLITCVLASNNLDDIDGDRDTGARTLAVRIGLSRYRLVYVTAGLAVIPAQVALWASGLFDAWILLPLLAAPSMLARGREVLALRRSDDPALATLTPRTAQVHLLFGLLLVVAVVLSRAL
jgi:1,4-dihydroxy-2-naphthoate polyprenyltransferase